MVCDGTPAQVALCNHVYEKGANNTVLRLPNNCAKGPFARVKSTFVPTNETIPGTILAEMQHDPNSVVVVRGLVLDYDFKSILESKGKLNFAITSTNAAHPVDAVSSAASVILSKESNPDLPCKAMLDATSAIASVATQAASAAEKGANNAASAVASVTTEGASAVKDGATQAASVVASAATEGASKVVTAAVKAADAAQNATSFNKTKTNGIVPLKLNHNFTLLDTDISCATFKTDGNAHVHLDMDVDMDAQVKYGYHLAGSAVPFELKDMSVFATLTGTTNTTFGMSLEAVSSLETLPIDLFKFGLPGLSIPGIASLGPELVFQTRLTMDLDVSVQMDV
ncbi:hypothetical protein M422DRAFT_51308 [Sphaerobolus stellatus SS14]|uniref:Uncharacterized protein n=1 Tax=Sphaerobolus stellatus (strain SS14) TaxID=990650 RepID=A0A0C9TZU0_SPHS4|nr:hypothetical protein M422DRAFT_51308 [Sphaerobolus stellatus SS14]